jgi:hypothetical protein
LTRPVSSTFGALRALVLLLAAAGWALSSGCALFEDLSSDPYRLVEAGPGKGCSGDGGCTSVTIACTPNCSIGLVCCISPGLDSSVSGACVAPSACSTESSFQLCESADECEGGSCITQTCTFNGTLEVRACTTIPFFCSTP